MRSRYALDRGLADGPLPAVPMPAAPAHTRVRALRSAVPWPVGHVVVGLQSVVAGRSIFVAFVSHIKPCYRAFFVWASWRRHAQPFSV